MMHSTGSPQLLYHGSDCVSFCEASIAPSFPGPKQLPRERVELMHFLIGPTAPPSVFGVNMLSSHFLRCSLPTSPCPRLAPLLLCLYSAIAICSGCGSSNPPPPHIGDFAISLSTNAVTQQAGVTMSAFNVSIVGQNGFTGSVSIAVTGLPPGSTTSPASPFTVAAGSSQGVTLSIPASVAAGSFQMSVNGTGHGPYNGLN